MHGVAVAAHDLAGLVHQPFRAALRTNARVAWPPPPCYSPGAGQTGISQRLEASTVASGGTTISHGGGLADRYAAALYDLADDEGALDQTVSTRAGELGRLIDESADFRRLLESPLIDVKQATARRAPCWSRQGFSPIIVKFVSVIAANRRLAGCAPSCPPFAALVANKRGVVTAHVATAHPLSSRAARSAARPADRSRLRPGQHRRAGGSQSLLGGMIVRIGARLLRQQHQVASAAPAIRHEGSRLRWISAPPRFRRS